VSIVRLALLKPHDPSRACAPCRPGTIPGGPSHARRLRAHLHSAGARYQAGGLDANGQPPERHVSDGHGTPCRHCLRMAPAGAGLLILAHRPFPAPQPYAEIGPIFVCADPATCDAPALSSELPAILASRTTSSAATGRTTASSTARGPWCPQASSGPRRRRALAVRGWPTSTCARRANTCYQVRIERGEDALGRGTTWAQAPELGRGATDRR
jgi:hypothetical protein